MDGLIAELADARDSSRDSTRDSVLDSAPDSVLDSALDSAPDSDSVEISQYQTPPFVGLTISGDKPSVLMAATAIMLPPKFEARTGDFILSFKIHPADRQAVLPVVDYVGMKLQLWLYGNRTSRAIAAREMAERIKARRQKQ